MYDDFGKDSIEKPVRIKASAKERLLRENFTVVLAGGDRILSSRERGIKPLIDIIESGEDVRGYVAADRIVGKAAALLYAYMGVSEVYAVVASESAATVCAQYGIKLAYSALTREIINRKGDGICPMEAAVRDIDEPEEAYKTLLSLSRR